MKSSIVLTVINLKIIFLTNGGPIVTFRSDNLVWEFKDLSVREIQPLTHS
jgi:hypothetical protein